MRSFVAVLLLSVSAVSAINEECVASECGELVECTYSGYKASNFQVPLSYSSMNITIYGGSGGAVLGTDNQVNQTTSGLGVRMVVRVTDQLPHNHVISILSGLNGPDAEDTKSGSYSVFEDRKDLGGNGGPMEHSQNNRYAGAGGSAAIIHSTSLTDNDKFDATLIVGGGGGSGAYLQPNGTVKGGDAPFIHKNNEVFPGQPGLPLWLSGTGGGENLGKGGMGHPTGGAHDGSRDTFKGGLGGDYWGVNNGTGIALAGGGAGSGFTSGGGGGFYVASNNTIGAAGSGGSGSSVLVQGSDSLVEKLKGFFRSSDVFTIIEQEHVHTADPKVVLRYTPKHPKPDQSCQMM